MHCPECGREEISAKSQFCRNCGFEIGDVKLLISEKQNEKSLESRRSNAFNQGLGLLVISLVLVIVMTLLRDLDLVPQFIVKIVAAVFVLAGLFRMFSPYVLTPEPSPQLGSEIVSDVETSKRPRELSPQGARSSMADEQMKLTSDPLGVPSVTEHTTRKLNNPEL